MTVVVVASLGLPILVQTNWRDRAALSLTTGVRNLSLALLLSRTFFSDEAVIAVLT